MEMNDNIDQIYFEKCKEYVERKKQDIQRLKEYYCDQMTEMVKKYEKIQARIFFAKYINKLR